MNTPRGIKNNNPGNIRKSDIRWQGKVVGTDPAFESFSSPEYGIRAMGRILRSYQRDGFDTVAEMIDRWAPPVENNTNAYVNAVAQAIGLAPHDKVDLADRDRLTRLLKAIVHHENGQQPYTDLVFERAIDLMG
jgi:hypothetical protein